MTDADRFFEEFGQWWVRISDRISNRISVEISSKRLMNGWIPPLRKYSTEIRTLLRPVVRLEMFFQCSQKIDRPSGGTVESDTHIIICIYIYIIITVSVFLGDRAAFARLFVLISYMQPRLLPLGIPHVQLHTTRLPAATKSMRDQKRLEGPCIIVNMFTPRIPRGRRDCDPSPSLPLSLPKIYLTFFVLAQKIQPEVILTYIIHNMYMKLNGHCHTHA